MGSFVYPGSGQVVTAAANTPLESRVQSFIATNIAQALPKSDRQAYVNNARRLINLLSQTRRDLFPSEHSQLVRSAFQRVAESFWTLNLSEELSSELRWLAKENADYAHHHPAGESHLAKWICESYMDVDAPICIYIPDYARALGELGFVVLEAELMAVESGLSKSNPIGPFPGSNDADIARERIGRARKELALARRDIDEIVRVFGNGLNEASQFLDVARALKKAGFRRRALAYAKSGSELDLSQAALESARCHAEWSEPESATEASDLWMRIFVKWPSLRTAKELRDKTGKQWQEHVGDEALTFVATLDQLVQIECFLAFKLPVKALKIVEAGKQPQTKMLVEIVRSLAVLGRFEFIDRGIDQLESAIVQTLRCDPVKQSDLDALIDAYVEAAREDIDLKRQLRRFVLTTLASVDNDGRLVESILNLLWFEWSGDEPGHDEWRPNGWE